MKAILEFDLSNQEEKKEHYRCVKSLDMALALFEIQMNLRKRSGENVDSIFEEIYKIINEYNINIEELVD